MKHTKALNNTEDTQQKLDKDPHIRNIYWHNYFFDISIISEIFYSFLNTGKILYHTYSTDAVPWEHWTILLTEIILIELLSVKEKQS